MDATDTAARPSLASVRTWDTHTAAGALVVGSLILLIFFRQAFRGVNVSL